MSKIFTSSEDGKTSDARRLKFNLTDKVDLKQGGRGVALPELVIYYKWKSIIKSHKRKLLDKPLNQIYVNKTDNRITFKVKTECYYELLTSHPKLSNYSKY